ncbi:YifB family Mg chelatase-like AAA ATPase [Halothiobacillus neapolitanus]|uniref:Mg chelatase, subunit ChlI n=1 Tax=Halothiobacillus neapolitanus (strain ATCC 23641 / DSM 15147 / CIP 104769 / NCIMB 8539 / c2) TaxID=555778 RepID=D0KXL4_HALNC|nr:YifB family Mg chelatase-like AAA ATPase [Halothiobacillus neapolitanus]ACX97202.1 Mg chelatase, subunit ChlI [Halothiobacillus neapolitanus c2]TDN60337.1 magnesium chelatase family protein [Halothiobacillus neapolitanus]
MSIAKVYSRAQVGIDAPLVTVEAHVTNGLPAITLVGLAETAVRESRDRVRAAILSSGFEFPPKRLTINLAPADLPKESARFDLAIAIAILAVTGQIPGKDAEAALQQLKHYEFLGELSLDGGIRPINGSLSAAIATRDARRILVLPKACGDEVSVIKDIHALTAHHLTAVVAHLAGQKNLDEIVPRPLEPIDPAMEGDLSEVRGQPRAKRALAIAAAGQHNLLLIGPPGAGKSMLAQRMPGILPPMTESEAIESARIASISSQGFTPERFGLRSFRSPHHSASSVALIGGGSNPKPGEISLAHFGVLFLDELPEFDRKVLEALREPLENGKITISRAAQQAEFPAQFQLIAAMNPSPQGVEIDSIAAQRYRAKLSGPLLDRIDMHLEIPRVPATEFNSVAAEETSAEVRARVTEARAVMLRRQSKPNAQLSSSELGNVAELDPKNQLFLNQAIEKLKLSGRARNRILKVARTIADLDGKPQIDTACLSEAMGYRNLDRLFRIG